MANLKDEPKRIHSIMSIMRSDSKVNRKADSVIDYSMKTGFPVIDYVFGYEEKIYDHENNDEYIRTKTILGIPYGTVNIVNGGTQSYKSSWLIKILANMIFKYGGNCYYMDSEGRTQYERLKNLTKLPKEYFIAEDGEEPQYSLISGAIGFDTIQKKISEIYKTKLQHAEELEYDTGEVDCMNRPIKLLLPTFIVIDSLQNCVIDGESYDVTTKNYDDHDTLKTNMAGAQTAKTIKGLINEITPMLRKANITLFMVLHQNDNVSTSAFMAPKKQFMYGSANVKLSGGNAVGYSATNIITLTGDGSNDGKYTKEKDGFNGGRTMFEPTKVTTNKSGNAKLGMGFWLVIDSDRQDFDNMRTLLLFMDQRGRLQGNKGGWLVLGEDGKPASDKKIKWKTVYDDFAKNKDLMKVFLVETEKELRKLVSKSTNEQIEVFDMDELIKDSDDEKQITEDKNVKSKK